MTNRIVAFHDFVNVPKIDVVWENIGNRLNGSGEIISPLLQFMARSRRLRESPTVCEAPILYVSYHLCISIASQNSVQRESGLRDSSHTCGVPYKRTTNLKKSPSPM